MEVCEHLSEGILGKYPACNIISSPMADGGDGSIEIIQSILNLTKISVPTVDPIGREITAQYFKSEDTAFIELASASGLVLLNEYERNPLFTSTRGTGLMIKHAIMNGLKKIYLFIGGSATNDAGIGIAQAIGFDFLSENDEQLEPTGRNLSKIKKINKNQLFDFDDVEIMVLCDVNNPMHGPTGAAHTYARQKGASDEDITELDLGLKNYDGILQNQLNKDLGTMAGMGAAGAVGASLVGLLDATLLNGFQMLSDLTQLETKIKNADLVITGEGKIDSTSFQGKVVGNVTKLCKKHQTPCGVISGMIEDQTFNKSNFLFLHSVISYSENINDAMTNAQKYLTMIGKEIGTFIQQ